ncbi:MAG: hypothetical protein JRH11_13130 [Deltaproteobacteria bacterium]|nr:hypothetical protein [Deltaproteobacteria bacterium]
MALVLVAFCLGACDEPTDAPSESQPIAPTPVQEAVGPSARQGGVGQEGQEGQEDEERAILGAPVARSQRPDGPGADLAERFFGEHSFRLAQDRSLPRRRRLYVYEAESDDGPCLVVLVGRVVDRVSAQRLPCSAWYVRPQVRLHSPEYGPGLLRVQMTSEHEAPTDSARSRARGRRAPQRTFRERREILFTLDRDNGLQEVHETVTSSNSIASASTAWDAGAGTLTTTIQRRNPPGRERCLRPRPETVVHAWRGGRFEETHRDPTSAPCGE